MNQKPFWNFDIRFQEKGDDGVVENVQAEMVPGELE